MSYQMRQMASVSRMAATCGFIVVLGTSAATSSVCAQQPSSPLVPVPAPASTSAAASAEPIIAPIRRVHPTKAAVEAKQVEAKQKAKQAATVGAGKLPADKAPAKAVPANATAPADAAVAEKSAKTGVVVYGASRAKAPAKAATSSR